MKEGQTEKRCDVEAEVIVMPEPQAKECGHPFQARKSKEMDYLLECSEEIQPCWSILNLRPPEL